MFPPNSIDPGKWWRNVPKLPKSSPIQSMKPCDEPKPHQVRPVPEGIEVNPDSAGAIIAAIFAHGWTFWTAGTPGHAFAASILEPRFGAV
jgi:hypothetical protein